MRRDNRKADELREIGVIYEGLDRVDGSATFRFGELQPARSTFSLLIIMLKSLHI